MLRVKRGNFRKPSRSYVRVTIEKMSVTLCNDRFREHRLFSLHVNINRMIYRPKTVAVTTYVFLIIMPVKSQQNPANSMHKNTTTCHRRL